MKVVKTKTNYILGFVTDTVFTIKELTFCVLSG